MKSISAVALVFALASAAQAASCNADNCNRQVLGTFRGESVSSARRTDCSTNVGTSTVLSYVATVQSTTTVTPGAVVTPTPAAPTSTKPAYASSCSNYSAYVSACSCGGITRGTTTVAATSTSVVTVYSPAALCGNAGLQRASFTDFQDDNFGAPEAALDFTVVKTKTPNTADVVNYAGKAYGTADMNIIETYRGYIFISQTGLYTFTTDNVDNILRAWVGPKAYSGWTNGNSDIFAPIIDPGTPGSGTFSTTLQGGQYVAFRIGFKQGVGPESFNFAVTGPTGTLLNSDPNSPASPNVIQYSCDGTTAPAYAPYGQEQ